MQKCYHYTSKKLLPEIIGSKKLDCPIGVNYVCLTEKDIKEFLIVCNRFKTLDFDDLAVIEFTTDTALEVSYDHNRDFIKADAYCSHEPIIIKEILNIFKYNQQ